MADDFTRVLSDHAKLGARLKNSQKHAQSLSRQMEDSEPLFAKNKASVFCAGSIGRGEVGSSSDADLFLISEEPVSFLETTKLLHAVISANDELDYPKISRDGQFLKIHCLESMTKSLGAPKDDSENLFTTRMVMLLESCAICNSEVYNKYIGNIADHYFRDSHGKSTFRPLFLLNDILRYWRTLCLNYELIRNNPDTPWHKKNVNLKFSRMLTVFGTVLPLIALPIRSAEDLISVLKLTPLERFATGLNELDDSSLLKEYGHFLNTYETFLGWKENSVESQLDEIANEKDIRLAAQTFSDYILTAIQHDSISPEFRKYLVI